jgi:hypothetical protein
MEEQRAGSTCKKLKTEETVTYDFEVGDDTSDLKLIVENKFLHVHKVIRSRSRSQANDTSAPDVVAGRNS